MSQYVAPGGTLFGSILVNNGNSNADTTPTAVVYRNGVVDNTVAVAVTRPTTGNYQFSAVLPIAYAVGDAVDILVSYTLSAAPIEVFTGLTTLIYPGYPFTQSPPAPVPVDPNAAVDPEYPLVFNSNVSGLNDVFCTMESGENAVTASTGALAEMTGASITSFLIPMTDGAIGSNPGTLGRYLAAVPANTPSRLYTINVYQPNGASPNGYALIGSAAESFNWSGTAQIEPYPVSITDGPYCGLQDIYAEMGEYNAQLSADADRYQDTAKTAYHFQTAINTATALVELKAKENGYIVPLIGDLSQVKVAARKYAAVELWQIRGFQRSNPDSDFMQKKIEADNILDRLFYYGQGGFKPIKSQIPVIDVSETGGRTRQESARRQWFW